MAGTGRRRSTPARGPRGTSPSIRGGARPRRSASMSLAVRRRIMNADLQTLGRRLVGRWTTDATHRGLPGAIIRGSSDIEWLEGEKFLIYRSSYDHPDIPDSISIIGDTEGLRMHYFDTRGVHRILKVTVTREGWE